MKIRCIDIEYKDEFEGLYCPVCGEEVAQSESPCEHITFIWLAMEPGDFTFVSKKFSAQAEKIMDRVNDITDRMENDEDVDEDESSIEFHLDTLEDTGTNFMIKVSSSENRNGDFSDLGCFGFDVSA